MVEGLRNPCFSLVECRNLIKKPWAFIRGPGLSMFCVQVSGRI